MKKSFVLILVFSLLLQLVGCYSSRYITKDEFLNSKKGDIKIVTNDNQTFNLKEGSYFVTSDKIYLDSQSNYKINPYSVSYIPLNDIKEFGMKEYDSTKTSLTVVIGAAVISVIVLFFSSIGSFKSS